MKNDSNTEELIKKLEEYVEFLGDIYADVYYFAHLHHYRESDFNLKKGKRLRQEIEELKNARK